jgi:hypothetical protein
MMSSSKFLDYEVTLLLAKYGKSALLEALAKKLELTPDQLEATLQTPPNRKSISHSRKKPPPVDLVKQLSHEFPNKAHLLQTLYERFENRAFLPELRDVRRFFEQHARRLRASKSRPESFEEVLKLLAELDVAELESLCQARPENAYSSLGLISDEILRRDR